MRYAALSLALLLLVGCGTNLTQPSPPAADDSRKSDDPVAAVIEPLTAAVAVMATVTDDKSAKEAKPQLDKLFGEAEAASERVEGKSGDGQKPDADSMKRMREVTARLQAEYDRIATKHKSALVVLREVKMFARLAEATDDNARMRAFVLLNAAKVHMVKNDGDAVTDVEVLVPYLDDGKSGLLDPWGVRYQIANVVDPATGSSRVFVFTTHPHTGKTIGAPKELEDAPRK